MTAVSAVHPRSTGHPGYNQTLPREPRTAAEARRLVRVCLATWGRDTVTDDAVTVMGELIANAVQHARGGSIRVIISRPADDRVLLAVVDRSPRATPQPVTPAPAPGDESGRGLHLIDDLAQDWGYDVLGTAPSPWGKRVWAVLDAKADPQ
ncbi:ATP-binding protein [Streptomyces sp. NPDC088785]|uniref:ATP-binding protein n=1 Tax=Streptomyces sp. NPDC088785 TaxID=3365897 RepID=UPI0038005D8A